MDTKWKNTIKKIIIGISILIIGIYLACAGCLQQKNALQNAWNSTEYYKTEIHLREVGDAFKEVVNHEIQNKKLSTDSPYSYLYATNFKVLENRVDYAGKNAKITAFLANIKMNILEQEGMYFEDEDKIEYTLATFENVSAYALADGKKIYVKGDKGQTQFQKEWKIVDEIGKPSNSFIVIAFEDSYLNTMDYRWQWVCLLFQIGTGLMCIAMLSLLYCAVSLAKAQRKARWKYIDVQLLVAVLAVAGLWSYLQRPGDICLYEALNRENVMPTVEYVAVHSFWSMCIVVLVSLILYSIAGSFFQGRIPQNILCVQMFDKLRKKKFYVKSIVKFCGKVANKFVGWILGTKKYPHGISRASKRVLRITGGVLGILTLGFVMGINYVYNIYNKVPVGYSVDDARTWYGKGKISFPEIVLHPKRVILLCAVYGVILLLVFVFYLYLNRRIYKSYMFLEEQIKNLHGGAYSLDIERAKDTPVYGSVKLLSEVGEGFERNLTEKLKSERMKVELITNVSHDLKTPLTSIISYIDLIKREGDLPESIREYVDILDQKSDRLKHIVQDVFELAKTTSGEIVVEKKELNINKLLVQTVSDFEDRIKASGMEVRLQTLEKEVIIFSDGARIYRVLQNLIDNALKYAMPGTRIYIREEMQPSDIVAVTITNISSYEIDFSSEEAMERFFRGDKSRQTEGSGLGLAIARGFTVACGGDFDIQIDGDQFKVGVAFPVKSL